MNELDTECAKLWAENPGFLKKVDSANSIIKDMLNKCTKPFVSFSCGKDSSVLAHMVLVQDNSIPLRFLSFGETRIVHKNVDEVIKYFNELGSVEEINVDRVFSEDWEKSSWIEQRKAGYKDRGLLNNGEYDCIFMGLRMEESRKREISLRKCKTENMPKYSYRYVVSKNEYNNEYKGNKIRCCPLATWTVLDVCAYIYKYNLPVLEWYQNFGINSRTTARITQNGIRQGFMTQFKFSNPQGYNKLMQRFPEFRLFV